MPCNSDHLNPTQYEKEARRMATLILHCYNHLGVPIPTKIKQSAAHVYGEPCSREKSEMDKLTATLCDLCESRLDDEFIYNGRNKKSRDLADWWEEHQEVDRKRESREKKRKQTANIRRKAMQKIKDAGLTTNELQALGLTKTK